jgi:hypothetical protein
MLNDMHENVDGNVLPTIETEFPPNSARDCREVFNNEEEKHYTRNGDIVNRKRTDEQSRNSSLCLKSLNHFDKHDNLDEDEFQLYLVNCIKYHAALIK